MSWIIWYRCVLITPLVKLALKREETKLTGMSISRSSSRFSSVISLLSCLSENPCILGLINGDECGSERKGFVMEVNWKKKNWLYHSRSFDPSQFKPVAHASKMSREGVSSAIFPVCAGKSNEKLISQGGEENVRHDIALTTLRGEFPSKLCLYTCENRWPNYLVSHCAQLFPDMCGRPFTECERRVTMRTSPSRFYHPALAISWELFAKTLISPSCEILHITPWMTKLN